MQKIRKVREKIVENLQTLVDAKDIAQVRSQSFGFDLLGSPSIKAYPVVFVTSPAFDAELLDSSRVIRSYDFILDVVCTGSQTQSDYFIDELKEKIADLFDKDFTLDGEALEVQSVGSVAASTEISGKRYIHFAMNLEVKTIFNFVE